MALTLRHQAFWIATICVLTQFFGKGTCQDLDCPEGIAQITAASGQIAYPESSSNYGVNETKCWKIQIPEIYERIGIYYHTLDIESCDDCECDSLTFTFNYTDWFTGLPKWYNRSVCSRTTSPYLKFLRMIDGPHKAFPGNVLYVRFSSDDSVNYKGFNFTFIAGTRSSRSRNYLNASDDDTIEFATRKFGVKNYPAGYEEQWYLIVPAGRKIQITFRAFELEQSDNCKNAYVEIREAYFDDGPFDDDIKADYGLILAEPMCGSNLPKPIRSAGNMAWVKFSSAKNSATAFKGFKASFKAVRESTNMSAWTSATVSPSALVSTSTSVPSSVSTSTSPRVSTSTSKSTSASFSPIVSASISPNVSTSVSKSTSASLSPIVSASISPSVLTSVSKSTSASLSPIVSASISPSVSTSASKSTSASLSPIVSASISLSVLTSASKSTSASLSPIVSPSISPSVSTSASKSTSASLSPRVSPSISPSVSASASKSTSASLSPRVSASISPSVSTSVSKSTSASLSPIVSASTSTSVSTSVSTSTLPSVSNSASTSTSASVSPSVLASTSTSVSARVSVSTLPSVSNIVSKSYSTSVSPRFSAPTSISVLTSSTSPNVSIGASTSYSVSPSVSASTNISASVSVWTLLFMSALLTITSNNRLL